MIDYRMEASQQLSRGEPREGTPFPHGVIRKAGKRGRTPIKDASEGVGDRGKEKKKKEAPAIRHAHEETAAGAGAAAGGEQEIILQ